MNFPRPRSAKGAAAMGKSVGKAAESPPRTTGVHLGSGHLFAIGVVVAGVAVYLFSPDGPRQVERCEVTFENCQQLYLAMFLFLQNEVARKRN